MRRVKLLQEMFEDVCSSSELQQIDQLYKDGNKASAIVLMLRKIKTTWDHVVKEASMTKPVFQGTGTAQLIKITCVTCSAEAAYVRV